MYKNYTKKIYILFVFLAYPFQEMSFPLFDKLNKEEENDLLWKKSIVFIVRLFILKKSFALYVEKVNFRK